MGETDMIPGTAYILRHSYLGPESQMREMFFAALYYYLYVLYVWFQIRGPSFTFSIYLVSSWINWES